LFPIVLGSSLVHSCLAVVPWTRQYDGLSLLRLWEVFQDDNSFGAASVGHRSLGGGGGGAQLRCVRQGVLGPKARWHSTSIQPVIMESPRTSLLMSTKCLSQNPLWTHQGSGCSGKTLRDERALASSFVTVEGSGRQLMHRRNIAKVARVARRSLMRITCGRTTASQPGGETKTRRNLLHTTHRGARLAAEVSVTGLCCHFSVAKLCAQQTTSCGVQDPK